MKIEESLNQPPFKHTWTLTINADSVNAAKDALMQVREHFEHTNDPADLSYKYPEWLVEKIGERMNFNLTKLTK